MKRFTIVFAATAAALLPLLLSGCGSSSSSSAAINRVYYIRATEKSWDYAPLGENRTLTVAPSVVTPADVATAAGSFSKTKFIGYSTTKTVADDAPAWKHLGILGPPIKAEVGDTIEVHFSNDTSRDLNLKPEGILYDADADGNPLTTTGAALVPAGTKAVYKWTAVNGPGFNDTSSIVFKYRSTVAATDENSGLLGAIIIYSKGGLGSGYTPAGIREFVTLFKTFDESGTPKRTINGYMFGNMTTLVATKGEKVRWYVMSGYADTDSYVPYWEVNPILFMQQETNSLTLVPPRDWVVEMVPQITGSKLFYSFGHQSEGMAARYWIK